jgi:SnoaL-like protein
MTAGELIDVYGAAWQECDAAARAALLARCWAQDGAYRDPSVAVDGRAALSEHMAGFQERMPGHRLQRTTAVDEHHGWLRFGWRMLDPAGQVVLEGMDVAERGGDGLLRRVVGFFGPAVPVDVGSG